MKNHRCILFPCKEGSILGKMIFVIGKRNEGEAFQVWTVDDWVDASTNNWIWRAKKLTSQQSLKQLKQQPKQTFCSAEWDKANSQNTVVLQVYPYPPIIGNDDINRPLWWHHIQPAGWLVAPPWWMWLVTWYRQDARTSRPPHTSWCGPDCELFVKTNK